MLRLTGVSVRYGTALAVDEVDLEVGRSERLSILGPSGSGKSTLLRAICGLEPLSGGRIEWDGRDLAGVPPHRRGFGLMFQDYVLFPHRNVTDNVAFGLRMAGATSEHAQRRVAEVLELVGLSGYERRAVTELSGGEQQRVALARALAPTPRLLMLDEPLGALDRALRTRLLEELTGLFEALDLPIVYVTHDQEEALAIGDRVAVMRAGRLEAVAAPDRLWHSPPNEFVAEFLGMANIADGVVDTAGRVITPWGTFSARPPGAAHAGDVADAAEAVPARGARRVLIRPDGFRPAADGPLRTVVQARTFRGDHTRLRVSLPGVDAQPLEVQADWPDLPAIGEELRLEVVPDAIVILP